MDNRCKHDAVFAYALAVLNGDDDDKEGNGKMEMDNCIVSCTNRNRNILLCYFREYSKAVYIIKKKRDTICIPL